MKFSILQTLETGTEYNLTLNINKYKNVKRFEVCENELVSELNIIL